MNRHHTLLVDPGLLLCLLLTLFLVLPLAQEPGLPVGGSTLMLLCFGLCSGGMYAFCRRRSGRLGALIAGLVYVYSPALMRNLAFARGDYSELLAMALFPLLLWRLDACAIGRSRSTFCWLFRCKPPCSTRAIQARWP